MRMMSALIPKFRVMPIKTVAIENSAILTETQSKTTGTIVNPRAKEMSLTNSVVPTFRSTLIWTVFAIWMLFHLDRRIVL